MNLRKIILEEIDDLKWMEDIEPSAVNKAIYYVKELLDYLPEKHEDTNEFMGGKIQKIRFNLARLVGKGHWRLDDFLSSIEDKIHDILLAIRREVLIYTDDIRYMDHSQAYSKYRSDLEIIYDSLIELPTEA